MKHIFFYIAMMLVMALNAQEVRVETDKQHIKIGEQIKYKISVETSTEEGVLFPDGQTFLPLEMVRASVIDTLRENKKFRLEKEYFLTQFDSGSYTIPPQRIKINTRDFYTDSLIVEVGTVAIDTLKQPLYDIKPIVEVSAPPISKKWWLIAGLFILLIIGLLLYFLIFRKKKLSVGKQRRKLPPFERAIQDLKNLQNSKYLIQSKHKEYYSELTDIVREYLEDEVHILAKESTTDELLAKIQLLQENGKLNLSNDTIINLKRVLQTADLVKFAKSKPSDNIAEYDRETIEDVVIKTKKAIPEPVANAEPSDEKTKVGKKQKNKRLIFATIARITSLIIAFVLISTLFNSNFMRNWLGSKYLQELNKSKWVTSHYGFPTTELTTPKVLSRRQIFEIKGFDSEINHQYVFDFGDINSELYIITSIVTFKQNNDNQQINLDIHKVNEIVLSLLEKSGAQNITTLEEEYTTPNGSKGIKVFGKMTLTDRKTNKSFNAAYEFYSFTENGALQQLLITHSDDLNAEEIAKRVVLSIDFKVD